MRTYLAVSPWVGSETSAERVICSVATHKPNEIVVAKQHFSKSSDGRVEVSVGSGIYFNGNEIQRALNKWLQEASHITGLWSWPTKPAPLSVTKEAQALEMSETQPV